MNYQIYNEDCLEGMKKIPDGSVDCIITDLPYNFTEYKWDKSGVNLTELWEQFKRILKPSCSALLFASGKFTYKLVASNFEWFKYKWFWIKNQPTMFVHAKNAPMRKVEEILVFSDGAIYHEGRSPRRMKYNPQGIVDCEILCTNTNRDGSLIGEKPSRPPGSTYIQNHTGYPSDVLYYDAPFNVTKLHPSQKPTDLLEYLIKTYTNEGETVLDATMGSGSTGVACVNTGRNFIGFETEKKFYDIALKRIATAMDKQSQALF